MRRLLLTCALLCASSLAAADELDYRPENGGWNGLSDFFALARGAGPQIEMSAEIDWDHVGPNDILVLVYPRSTLDPKALRAFVRSGGRVILADDFGAGGPLFEALDIERRDFQTVTSSPRLFGDNPNLPIAKAMPARTPLSDKISEIVTNHPAVIWSDKHAMVFGFGPKDGVVIEGQLGQGRFVAISDPSILINVMLGFEGNFAFATNLVRSMAPTTADRLLVIAQEFKVKGRAPVAPPERSGLAGRIGEVLVAFNSFLDELNDYLAPDKLFRWIVRFAVLPLLLALLLVVPWWWRGASLDGRWTQPATSAHRLDPHELGVRFDHPAPSLPFNYPAAVLRDDVERRLDGALDLERSLSQDPRKVLGLLAAHHGAEAASRAERLLPRLRNLPTRSMGLSAWLGRFVTRAEFDRLYDEAAALEQALAEAGVRTIPPQPKAMG